MMYYIKFIKNQYPKRIERFIKHFIYPFYRTFKNPAHPNSLSEWFMDVFFYTIDLLLIPEFYMFVNQIMKCNTRPMLDDEIFLAKEIFGDTLDVDVIRIDSHTMLGTKKIAVAYVSFNLINFKNHIEPHVFVHELVHVWQFQNLGSIYIGRALKAQLNKNPYDYGGPEDLMRQMIKGKKLLDYSFEQQAEIIEDYYRLGQFKDWQRPINLAVYEYFKQDLQI